MSLENAKEINKRLIKEKHIINKSKKNIEEAEKIIGSYNKDISNTPIYIGLVLLLITLIALSFFTVKLFNSEEIAPTTIVNNYHTHTNTDTINNTFVNIESEEKMVCLFEPNATEGRCYKKVGK